jgi:type IV secretory pathway TrbD component
MVGERDDAIHGYHVPILRGVWERILTLGAPRRYCHCWAACCLFAGLCLLTLWGFRWIALPFLAWIVGHGVLVLLTQWNPKFDEMVIAQLNQRYKSRYSAG